MKKIGLVTDSNSGITASEAARLGIMILPMPFYINEECYYEQSSVDEAYIEDDNIKTITPAEFYKFIDSGAKVSTSQPSPLMVTNIWDKALEQYEQILYIPLSSGLSGSFQTANMLAMDDKYERKVFVVDNGRVSTLLHRSVLDALELIEQGKGAQEIKEILEKFRADMTIYVAVDDLNYLLAGGRISKTSASLASLLNIKPILKFDISTLDLHKKCRSFKKARGTMIETLREDLKQKFGDDFSSDKFFLLAASSADEATTDSWIEEIKEAFPGIDVMCDALTMSLACHIGPGGLGIGYSTKPY